MNKNTLILNGKPRLKENSAQMEDVFVTGLKVLCCLCETKNAIHLDRTPNKMKRRILYEETFVFLITI